MSWQRKHGQAALVWPMTTVIDRQGNRVKQVDLQSDPIKVRAAFIPERSSRAEVPGQQQVNVVNMVVDYDLEGVGLWSRVRWNGFDWDVAAPPSYHHGTRQTRHWSIPLRQRPLAGLGPGEVGDG